MRRLRRYCGYTVGFVAGALLTYSAAMLAWSSLPVNRPSPVSGPPFARRVSRAAASSLTPNKWLIEAVGQNNVWQFRYPGGDQLFGTEDDICTDHRVHLPLDADIHIVIKSLDYVYFFSVPRLGLRRVAVPELAYSLDFHTREAGVFDIVSDPMCGVRLFHDELMGQVLIEPDADFQKWLRRQSPRASSS